MKNNNLCDTVTDELLRMIKEGIFKPGEQLPNEIDLSEQLSVSRTTLREAKSNLVAMNILTKHRGRGTFVVDKEMLDRKNQQFDRLKFDQSRMAALFEIRMIMEPDIARLAAEKATDEEINQIEEIERAIEESCDQPDKVMQYNSDFHNAICNATHNEFLIRVFHNINQAIRDNKQIAGEESHSLDKVIRSHQLIVGFLKLRDAIGVRDAMELHLQETMEEFHIIN